MRWWIKVMSQALTQHQQSSCISNKGGLSAGHSNAMSLNWNADVYVFISELLSAVGSRQSHLAIFAQLTTGVMLIQLLSRSHNQKPTGDLTQLCGEFGGFTCEPVGANPPGGNAGPLGRPSPPHVRAHTISRVTHAPQRPFPLYSVPRCPSYLLVLDVLKKRTQISDSCTPLSSPCT